jgi:hypothetical protein
MDLKEVKLDVSEDETKHVCKLIIGVMEKEKIRPIVALLAFKMMSSMLLKDVLNEAMLTLLGADSDGKKDFDA